MVELLKDDNAEVKQNVINGLLKIAKVLKTDMLTQPLMVSLGSLTKDGQWRVRSTVFELIANLGLMFGREPFTKMLQPTFITYMTNTAASVRKLGV
jgi:hypothetical protein